MSSRRRFFSTVFTITAGNTLSKYAFALPSKSNIKLRFAIASDGHYGEAKTQFENNFREMVEWINLEKENRGVDFTMINGDIIHNNPDFLTPAKVALDKLSMPYYVSRGNHDHIPEPTWLDTWKMGSNHAFEIDDIGFITLSTTDESGKYICPDLEWTHKHLTLFTDKKHVFVFMHITPVKWTDNANPCSEIVEMFNNQKNLRAIFNGHDHDQDHIKDNDGKPYFFDAHLGGSWGTDYRGFRIVEVMNNGTVITYQLNPSSGMKINTDTLKG
ncbi:MAG: metallophosphoesterase [Chitinophagaceae bacterium]